MENDNNHTYSVIWVFFVFIFIILIAFVLFYFYNKYKVTSIYKFEREDKPIVQIENLSDSLRKIGKLAEKDNDKSFAIFVNEVKNETSYRGKLPYIIRTIISSAFINISSKKVIVKASYNIENLPLYPSDIYIINGAITEFIQTKKLIYIKLNLNPWNARTGNYISGMNTEVSMSFYETKMGIKALLLRVKLIIYLEILWKTMIYIQ